MKQCPACSRSYSDNTLVYCLDDGSVLASPRANDITQPMPSPRMTNPPPTEAFPQVPTHPQPVRQPSNTPLILVLASVLALFLIAGGILIAWLSLRSKNKGAVDSSASSASQSTTNQSKSEPTNSNSSTVTEKSPAWKLVGVWQCVVTELGTESEITYTFVADGTSKSVFRTKGRPTETHYNNWQYSEGVLYERFANGVSGKGRIEWLDDDNFEITIFDNGVPAYNGLKRRYRRIG